MHKDPDPIFHRDIRWENIVQCADDSSKWFLIDWEDAASPPTMPATHFDRENHCPAVYEANHGHEVDIWSVGMLIKETSRSILRSQPELVALGVAMQTSDMTAIHALERLQALQSASGMGVVGNM
jgi:hypothetical protein